MSVEYLHCSFAGSYYVDCDIIKQLNEWSYLISYVDPWTNDTVTKEVEKKTLRFVAFGDLVI